MFGETQSESPRLPSPWLSRSSGGTPSPLALATPDSSTPPGRRRSSLEALEVLDGLAEDFDGIALGRGKLSTSPAMEEITVQEVGMETLEPEVDHQGHIEYKLKLLTPTSLHRLEKLRTQLKWRLVEGGGMAVYELGVLDSGGLVGLAQDDMEESLHTLGQMLAGLGGGSVQVTRVVRLGGGGRSGVSSSSSPSTSPGALFPSFDVPFDTDDLAYIASTTSLSGTPPLMGINPETSATSLFPPARTRGPTPIPSNRTPDEQAELRRAKREARRQQRRDATLLAPAPLHPHPFQAAHPGRVSARDKPTKPPKPPRARGARRGASGSSSGSSDGGDTAIAVAVVPGPVPRTPSANAPKSPPGGDSLYKPALLKEGDTEVRYVVEAVVCKAGTPERTDGAEQRARGRRKSSAAAAAAMERDDELAAFEVLAADEEDDEDGGSGNEVAGEGWSFLEFDLEQLASSVKSAAAAAAAAEGRAPAPLATAAVRA